MGHIVHLTELVLHLTGGLDRQRTVATLHVNGIAEVATGCISSHWIISSRVKGGRHWIISSRVKGGRHWIISSQVKGGRHWIISSRVKGGRHWIISSQVKGGRHWIISSRVKGGRHWIISSRVKGGRHWIISSQVKGGRHWIISSRVKGGRNVGRVIGENTSQVNLRETNLLLFLEFLIGPVELIPEQKLRNLLKLY